MKNLLLSAALLALSSTALAQGTIVFNNRVVGSIVAPIYSPDPAQPWNWQTGNTVDGFPAGTTVYAGAPLSGSGYTVQLWGAPGANQTISSLVPATGYSTAGFRTGTAAGFWTAGTDAAIIPGAAEGSIATLQVRAWENQGGTITSWSAVQNLEGISGTSRLFNSQPLGGTSAPPNLIGLQSFNLVTPLPEPSSFYFTALIGAALLGFRRKAI